MAIANMIVDPKA